MGRSEKSKSKSKSTAEVTTKAIAVAELKLHYKTTAKAEAGLLDLWSSCGTGHQYPVG